MSDALRNLKTVRKRRYSVLVAVLVLLLCLMGLYTVGKYCVGVAKDLLNKTAQKQEYEQMLMPLVMFDTVTFEDPATLDNTTLLQSSIWAILLGENRDYAYDESRNIVVPASDVNVACQKLFGSGVKLDHASFGDYSISYYYDEEIKSYRIPLAAIFGYYTPQVEKITKSGDSIKLEVGYIPPASALNYSVTGEAEANRAPSKFMEYELRRGENGAYHIYSLRLISSQLVGGGDAYTEEYYSASSQYEIGDEEQLGQSAASEIATEPGEGGGSPTSESAGASASGGSSAESGASSEAGASSDGEIVG